MKKKPIHYIMFAALSAIFYICPIFFYIKNAEFKSSWILYIGNLLFAGVIAVYLFFEIRERNFYASATRFLKRGYIIAIIGIAFSVIFSLLLLFIMVPDFISSSPGSDATFTSPPAQLRGHNNGFVFILLLDAVVGNFSTASFVALMVSVTSTKSQRGESETGEL